MALTILSIGGCLDKQLLDPGLPTQLALSGSATLAGTATSDEVTEDGSIVIADNDPFRWSSGREVKPLCCQVAHWVAAGGWTGDSDHSNYNFYLNCTLVFVAGQYHLGMGAELHAYGFSTEVVALDKDEVLGVHNFSGVHDTGFKDQDGQPLTIRYDLSAGIS
jgi:hypothetical protein